MPISIGEQQKPAEDTPLLHDDRNSSPASTSHRHEDDMKNALSKNLVNRLYLSHFLSTWNSRVFEFGAVLYLAAIYPGTLSPLSVYALSRGLAAIIFAPTVGHYIDVTNRLKVVRLSIVLQRLAVATSCVLFYILLVKTPITQMVDIALLATLAVLACIEKLGSVMNLISVERDWVVVVAGDNHENLKTMNAQMRRVDLFCKLIGPLSIALIDVISTNTAILVNFGMNVLSVVIEYHSIAKVYSMIPALNEPKQVAEYSAPSTGEEPQGLEKFQIWKPCQDLIYHAAQDLAAYTRNCVFLPSFAGALLYLTVLSFSGQMITWLLSAGYDSALIATTRTLSVAFEFLATWIAPWIMGRVGTTRAGLWLACWQIACLVAGTSIFSRFIEYPFISASGLVGGTIMSRVGLRGFDLCVQIIVQEGVDADIRGSFSSTEAAWQSFFEICSYVSTIIFSRPDQFKWPILISITAVCLAGVLYAIFVRIQRGHLIHMPRCLSPDRIRSSRQQGLTMLAASEF